MTPPPDDTPWWAWLLAVVLVAAITALATWWTQRPVRRAAEQAAASAAHAATELTPNHGSSAKDALGRLEELVAAVDQKVDAQALRTAELAHSVGGLRDDLRQERAQRAGDVRDLGGRVFLLEQARRQPD